MVAVTTKKVIVLSHQYAKEGKYRAGVTVTDSSGQSASDSVDISITAAPSAETGSDTGTTKSPSGTNPDQTNIGDAG